ncbi:MAG: hypothetical protein ACTHNE_20720 [Dyella sp.]
MPDMTAEVNLRQHYVAFLDVLGFKEMVEEDIRNQKEHYLTRLFACHQGAAMVFREKPSCTITQFSDSIVVALPYDASDFQWFVRKIADYQRLLLDEGFLCRGGIAVNKHFSNGTFTFSAGLIQAYKVESKLAKYPRVVVSPEVLELIYADRKDVPPSLVLEDDGLLFVDYLGLTKEKRKKGLQKKILEMMSGLSSHQDPSVREKAIWLAAYSDSALATSHAKPRFFGGSVRRR